MGFKLKIKENKLEQKVKYTPGKRHISKIYWYILILLILSPFVYLGSKIFVDTFIEIGTGHVTFDNKIVRAPNDSYVEEIFIKEHETVKINQPIAQLFNQNIDNDLKYHNNELVILKDRKKKLLKNPQLLYLASMKQKAEDHLKKTKKYLDTMEGLRRKGLGKIQEVQQGQRDFDEASQQVHEIERRIEAKHLERKLLLETDIDRNIRRNDNEIKKLNISKGHLKITAPESGVVDTIYANEGEFLRKGQSIAHIVTKKNMKIIVFLKASHFSEKIKKGQNVTIVLPDNRKIKGKVLANPILAKIEPNTSNLVRDGKNKILVTIVPNQDFPVEYKIFHLPVKVYF
jgi:multidrug resistance efflux pump